MKKNITIVLLLAYCTMPFAKNVGSFDATITFMSATRTLSCYVPNNYDSTKPYQLIIGLHGLGDNSSNYRNSLINSLKWQLIYPNTIIICPDGGSDNNRDFYTPAGDEDIINQAVVYAKGNYNINNNSVYLQGFSLGGRSALKFGLDNPAKFKGLLLNTPAIQGLLDLKNHPVGSIKYNYANAKDVSIFISVGQDDYLYYQTVTELTKILKQNNARIKFQSVPGMGHSIAVNSYMAKGVDFFNRTNNTTYDLDLFKVETNLRQCNNMIQATVYIYNTGDSTVRSMDLEYSFGLDNDTKKWTGTLLPNNFVAVPFTLNITNAGVNDLEIKINEILDGHNDGDTTNNLIGLTVNEFKSASLNTVQEGFETEVNGWDILPTGSIFEWYTDTDVKRTGVSSLATFNTILIFYSLGDRNSFISPFVNISSLTQKSMTFDVAYNFHRYTPPYVTTETDFADTLEILISTDCGATYSSIYKKGGKELATAPSPILNPLAISDCFFAPTNDQWRTEILDLRSFSSSQNALFKFDYISGMGGSINLDNVSLGTHNLSLNTVKNNPVRIFPNPAHDKLTIDLTSQGESIIHIYNSNGQLVYDATSAGKELLDLNIGTLNSGIYSIEVTNADQRFNDKISVVK
jgi:predicted esterase